MGGGYLGEGDQKRPPSPKDVTCKQRHNIKRERAMCDPGQCVQSHGPSTPGCSGQRAQQVQRPLAGTSLSPSRNNEDDGTE